jgi:hypothetical protein
MIYFLSCQYCLCEIQFSLVFFIDIILSFFRYIIYICFFLFRIFPHFSCKTNYYLVFQTFNNIATYFILINYIANSLKNLIYKLTVRLKILSFIMKHLNRWRYSKVAIQIINSNNHDDNLSWLGKSFNWEWRSIILWVL